VIPKSRYVPIVQQPWHCIPACMSMIMNKNGMTLKPQEELGHYMGLVVPSEDEAKFYNPEVREKPLSWGYGPQYSPDKAFTELGIPIVINKQILASELKDVTELLVQLRKTEQTDGDALLCFRYGVAYDTDYKYGHGVVFDRVVGDEIQVVDPIMGGPQWRWVKAEKMFAAIQEHGDKNFGGIWLFKKK